jgi:hypothetical protein
MVFNATFNNMSVISWRPALLMKETWENHRPVASHWQTLSHNVVHLALIEIRTHNISSYRHWLHRYNNCMIFVQIVFHIFVLFLSAIVLSVLLDLRLLKCKFLMSFITMYNVHCTVIYYQILTTWIGILWMTHYRNMLS